MCAGGLGGNSCFTPSFYVSDVVLYFSVFVKRDHPCFTLGALLLIVIERCLKKKKKEFAKAFEIGNITIVIVLECNWSNIPLIPYTVDSVGGGLLSLSHTRHDQLTSCMALN